jgi:hypothetical protein
MRCCSGSAVSLNAKTDKKRKLVKRDLPPGAFVMIIDPDRQSKHDPRNYGPFMVVRKSKRSQTYTLCEPFTNKVLPTSIPISQLVFVSDESVPLTSSTGEDIDTVTERGVVNAIMEHRVTALGGTEFRVRWTGYPQERDSWAQEQDFDSGKTLTDYWRRVSPGKERATSKATKAKAAKGKAEKGKAQQGKAEKASSSRKRPRQAEEEPQSQTRAATRAAKKPTSVKDR